MSAFHRPSRRSFLQLSATAGSLALAGCRSQAALLRATGPLRHASIGVGGMGAADLAEISAHPGVRIVALCDVDRGMLEQAAQKHPDARLYRDWRELFAAEGAGLDSVNVSTPDHMHAPITLDALGRRLHVYCQKPLTHTVAEARAVARAARRSGAVTQMGIQNHSAPPYREAIRLLRRGLIGAVREVHVWTDRPAGWWAQGVERSSASDPLPEALDWDGWLGVAPERPFVQGAYHPFHWRGRLDFGTGAQGDMACHLMDPALWFLELQAPLTIRSLGPAPGAESYPEWSTVRYRFPASPWTAADGLELTWYDGGKLPPRGLLDELGAGEVWGNGCLFLGERGALLTSPYDPARLLPEGNFEQVERLELPPRNHWHQWIDACFGIDAASAPFDYAAQLTEVALLGNVALHFPQTELAWDASRMRFPGQRAADRLLDKRYRSGFSLTPSG